MSKEFNEEIIKQMALESESDLAKTLRSKVNVIELQITDALMKNWKFLEGENVRLVEVRKNFDIMSKQCLAMIGKEKLGEVEKMLVDLESDAQTLIREIEVAKHYSIHAKQSSKRPSESVN